MAVDDSEFPRIFRGYDPEHVDRTILRLRRELLSLKGEVDRITLANSEMAEEVEKLRLEIDQVGRPTFSGLGHTLEKTLRTAEEQAARLAQKAEADAYNAKLATERERERALEAASESARALVATAELRAEHLLQDALTRSASIVDNAERKARNLIEDATRDAADTRRTATTERTREQATARRELEALRAEAESEFAQLELVLTTSAQKTDKKLNINDEIVRVLRLNADLASNRERAEQEYLAKHQEAVHATEEYLAAANADLATARRKVADAETAALVIHDRALKETQALRDAVDDRARALLAQTNERAATLLADAGARAREIEAAAEASLADLKTERDVLAAHLEAMKTVIAQAGAVNNTGSATRKPVARKTKPAPQKKA